VATVPAASAVAPVAVQGPAASTVSPGAAPAARGRLRPWLLRGTAGVLVAAFLALLLLGLAQVREERPRLDGMLASARSIAVLPFVDLSDPPAPHVAHAVDSDLVTDLGRHADLRVIVYASAADPLRAGRTVNARHVLAGSVQRSGDAVSINVRLMRTDSGELLWSGRFDYPSFADSTRRRDISARVANLLGTKVTAAVLADAVRRAPDGAAVDHWMRGHYLLGRVKTKAELQQARAHFEAALAAEPESVPAIAGLAITHVCEVRYRWSADRKASLATAGELARRALEIDPDDQSALQALAGAQMFDGDLEGAMSTTRRELEINPSDAHANLDLAAALYFLGRWDEALRQLEVAEQLNPLDALHLEKIHAMASTALIALRRYDEALVHARRLQAVAPNNSQPYLYEAAAQAYRGDLDAAHRAASELLRRRPDFAIGGGDAQRGSTAPAYLTGLGHLVEGLRLAGLPERQARAPR
jgi:TolB-like protein/Flp pilus assembly protein TadD